MILISSFVVASLMFTYYIIRKSPIYETSKRYFVNGNGEMTDKHLLDDYSRILFEIRRCCYEGQLDDLYCMLEYFRQEYGDSKYYEELYNEFKDLENSFFLKW